MTEDKYSKIVRAGRTDEEMSRDLMTAHQQPEDMVFSPFGGPYPRLLPDGRVIRDGSLVSTLSDEEAMEWLDGIEQLEDTPI